MKRVLFLVVFVAIAAVFFAGCKEDTVTTSQNQPPAQPSEEPSGNPTPPDDPDTTEPDLQQPVDSEKICYANNFAGEKFRVVEYADKIIVASKEPTNCRLLNDRLKGEVRRGGVRGLREFVGDVRAIHGNRITIYTGKLPALCLPKKGETLKVIWKGRRHKR